MFRIAVVGNSHADCIDFIKSKFKDKIKEMNNAYGMFTLINGDIVNACYGEANYYLSVEIDTYIVTPNYKSLEDVIKHRCYR